MTIYWKTMDLYINSLYSFFNKRREISFENLYVDQGAKGVTFYFRPVVRSVKLLRTGHVVLILIQQDLFRRFNNSLTGVEQ